MDTPTPETVEIPFDVDRLVRRFSTKLAAAELAAELAEQHRDALAAELEETRAIVAKLSSRVEELEELAYVKPSPGGTCDVCSELVHDPDCPNVGDGRPVDRPLNRPTEGAA